MEKKHLGEFDIIHTYFKPLAKGSTFAMDLTDDAAIIPYKEGEQMVISTDTSTTGVHFPHDATPSQMARRSLRTSLSDLAAMGARPIGYLMSLSLPSGITEDWLQEFCAGLREDQSYFDVHLLGGDMTHAPHDLSITMTVVGSTNVSREYRRSTAVTGAPLYVTGTIGDAYLGLKVLQGHFPWLEKKHQQYLINRYYLPEPRLHKALRNCPMVTAAIDISDGLLQDLEHLCIESRMIAHITQESIPLSVAARAVLASKEVGLIDLLAGGDDYELILAMNPHTEDQVRDLYRFTKIPLTQIGYMGPESPDQARQTRVHLVDQSGQRIQFTKKGYEHQI